MDSLTQIVLGAACGEVALGKKIGNKAMLFGAIGGTIPDLDVFIGPWLYSNEIDAMAFHRGFMHSITFAILGSFLFGWITFRLYNSGVRKGSTSLKNWIWLYFLSIFTHPILDCFTPYGTQLFLPFSNYRVAFNNIAVVDPLYTVPFLLCLLVTLFYNRKNKNRVKWVQLGIIISSIYMIFTLGNKLYIDATFKKYFNKQIPSYQRFSAQPTIFNNLLWYGIAETESNYQVAFYSLLDAKNEPDTLITIPKKHPTAIIEDIDIQTLRWFSNDYFNIQLKNDTNHLEYIDLRYPLLDPKNSNSSVFKFELTKKDTRWDIIPFSGKPPTKEALKPFMNRILGKK